MQSNIRLGRISGIEIGLHYSWFIIAALIMFSLGEHFRQVYPNWGTSQIWVTALFTAVLFFVSLLLHELSHFLGGPGPRVESQGDHSVRARRGFSN